MAQNLTLIDVIRVDMIAKFWGNDAGWNSSPVHSAMYEATTLKLDCSKALNQLNWKPRWSLDLALQKTVEWYKAYEGGHNMNDLSLSQIDQYSKSLE